MVLGLSDDVGKDEKAVFFQNLDVGECGTAMSIHVDAKTACPTACKANGTDAESILVAIEDLESLGGTADGGENCVEANGIGFEAESCVGAGSELLFLRATKEECSQCHQAGKDICESFHRL